MCEFTCLQLGVYVSQILRVHVLPTAAADIKHQQLYAYKLRWNDTHTHTDIDTQRLLKITLPRNPQGIATCPPLFSGGHFLFDFTEEGKQFEADFCSCHQTIFICAIKHFNRFPLNPALWGTI